MTMTPLEALQDRIAMVRYWRSDIALQTLEGMERVIGRYGGQSPVDEQRQLVLDLSRSDTYWVTADMMTVVRNAAAKMPDESLIPGLLPSWRGFCRFQTPLPGIDALRPGSTLTTDAVAWAPVVRVDLKRPAVQLHWFSSWPADIPRSGGCPPLLLTGSTTWVAGEPASLVGRDYDTDLERSSAEEDRRFIAALWTIMQQRSVSTSSVVRPSRPVARKMERMNIESPGVRIVELRRRSTGTEGDGAESPVDWTHRWIVGGHWRNQYLPSSDGHRLQYIAPYVKGPEDKPLVVKDTVKALVR